MTAIAFDHAVAARKGGRNLTAVYVWDLPVRLTHALIVLSVLVLSATGIYIGHPFIEVSGAARDHFLMGWMRAIHFYASIVFTLSVLARIVWMFIGNRYAKWDEFIPTSRERWRGLWATFRFYLVNPREPLGFIGHNPLAGIAYSLVFVLFFVMIATGFALYSANASVGSPMRVFQFLIPVVGGLQLARYWHHITMWLLLAFMVQHIYSAILASIIEGNGTLSSIVGGFKFVSRGNREAANAKS